MSTVTELTDEQQEILRTIRDFVDRDVLPNVSRYDHADEFPEPLVRDDARARPVRHHDPRGVRRPRAST